MEPNELADKLDRNLLEMDFTERCALVKDAAAMIRELAPKAAAWDSIASCIEAHHIADAVESDSKTDAYVRVYQNLKEENEQLAAERDALNADYQNLLNRAANQ